MDFINMVMKPFVIVVETQNRSKFPKPTEWFQYIIQYINSFF
jgi:hypothetical protein